jgi:aspartate racemase
MTLGRHLGLIGGLGPDATVNYYRQLIAIHDKAGRTPRLTIAHADVAAARACVSANDIGGLARYLNQFIGELAKGGAELTAVVAVTPHICAKELTTISPLPLVDMIAEVARVLYQRRAKRVALIGTRFTIETRMFGGLADIDVVMPPTDRIARIDELYFDFVEGRGSAGKLDELREIARAFVHDDGAEAVLVAGTDLSMHINQFDASLPLIDCAQIHIDAIAAWQLS